MIALNIYAETVTPDGLKLTPSRHIYAKSFDKFPKDAEIVAVVEKMATDLTALRKAPIFDETYIGPVLFTERAAVQVFSQLVAPNLAAGRAPLNFNGDGDEGALTERLNRRILPASLTIKDDPTIDAINNYGLIGNYELDAQGVAAKPLTIVENGIFKNQLASRLPTKKYPSSNGRARSSFGTPSISNLVVQSSGGKTFAELKQELINACKLQNMPYGIILREVDSTFNPTGRSLSPPIMAYKVYVEDGREELVRHASIDAFPIRELRQLLGVGNDSFSLNHLNGNGHMGEGIPFSVTAPSILMDELVIRKDTSTKAKPLIMTHPYFDSK
jgi:predicted Zn-dependent protease